MQCQKLITHLLPLMLRLFQEAHLSRLLLLLLLLASQLLLASSVLLGHLLLLPLLLLLLQLLLPPLLQAAVRHQLQQPCPLPVSPFPSSPRMCFPLAPSQSYSCLSSFQEASVRVVWRVSLWT